MKGRQLRRKEEESESDDEASTIRAQLQAKKAQQTRRTSSIPAALSTAGPRSKVSLSFEDGSDEEVVENFVLKKSRASRMLQETGHSMPLPEFDPFAHNQTHPTSFYDAESLAALKMSQNFSLSAASVSHEDMMESGFEVELVGDDAEAFEQRMEANEEAREKDSYIPGMYSAASRAAEDEFLLRSGRASTAALKKEKHIPDDDLSGKLSGIQQDKTKTDFEAPGLDLNDWEEELLRRSGIKAHSIHELDVRSLKSTVKALNAGTTSTGASPASKLSQSRGYSSERNFLIDIPSTEEIIGNIDKAIQSLEIGTSDTRKRIEQLTKAHDDALKAEVEAETVFAKANEKMKIIVKFQYFCAEYVGMIREKDTHILALKDELFTHLRERKENLRQRRLLDQEDLTMRVKENGGFISFGSYTPIGALLFEAEENLEQQQREYKRKFRISKRLGLETKSFDGSSLEVLEAELGSDIDVNVEEETEYASKITAISMRASKLLDDVKLDLRSVGIVVENFKEMKRADPEKYKNGYFGISLPGILEPLVLLDALSACTLKDEYILSTRDWHEPLRQYSVEAEEASDTGDEAVLLPKLVTKIFLPFAENFLSSHFDPFSSTSSKYALSLIEQILEYDPSTEELATVIQALSHECNIAQESICIPFLTVSIYYKFWGMFQRGF